MKTHPMVDVPGCVAHWVLAGLLGAGACCAQASDASLFSAMPAGEVLPAGWQRVPFSDRKKQTRYELVDDAGRTVLQAHADRSVSFALHEGVVDLRRTPMLRWNWRIGALPRQSDIKVSARDDAAARVVLMFDGNRDRLPLADRLALNMAQRMSGREMPYATMMYVATPSAALGSYVRNALSGRVQMVVASKVSGPGDWIALQRDVAADFRIAFGEEPGRLIAYGVMSDSDNTGSTAQAWYGDIRFVEKR